jgi:hypothetical protein
MQPAFFTICSRNYLAYALTLQQSLKRHAPDAPFFIYLADAPLDQSETPDANIIPVSEIGLPNLLDMAFRYTVMEFNTAIKADCFLDLLTRQGFEAAIYLDPDILVFAPLSEVSAALGGGASAVLTPHLLAPLPAGAHPGEAEILKSGVFNLGFAAFANTPESLAFIRWWADKLHSDCYSAPEKGLFVDQKFVDFAPAFIERLTVLRHPGYNVAYWNTSSRSVVGTQGEFTVNGAPLVFFHFSGVVPGQPNVYSKHLGGRKQDVAPAITDLVRLYLSQLSAQGNAKWSAMPYAYARFRDGSPILPPMRRHPPERGTPEDWFEAPDLKYWTAPDSRINQKRGLIITRLMMGIWDARPDLQAEFHLSNKEGRVQFYDWYATHAVREYDIPVRMQADFLSSGDLWPLKANLRYAALSLRNKLKTIGRS